MILQFMPSVPEHNRPVLEVLAKVAAGESGLPVDDVLLCVRSKPVNKRTGKPWLFSGYAYSSMPRVMKEKVHSQGAAHRCVVMTPSNLEELAPYYPRLRCYYGKPHIPCQIIRSWRQDFIYVVAHELFHIFQNKNNLGRGEEDTCAFGAAVLQRVAGYDPYDHKYGYGEHRKAATDYGSWVH